VTNYQVSGLTPLHSRDVSSTADQKSSCTLNIEPGGLGWSGTDYVWEATQEVTKRFSNGQFDVLGWDPRGVNISLPTMACYPEDTLRDRWTLLTRQHRQVTNPMDQLQIVDAMNDTIYYSCLQKVGDLGRVISTALEAL
jgi:hypothetical protein